jgi:hypothetical protein
MKKFMFYTAALIGLYLVVANATGFGKALTAVSQGYAAGVRELQGR